MALEELQSSYQPFYTELTNLVNDLVSKVKEDAPPELKYATTILDILPTDDPDFQSGNEDGVVTRARIVLQFTTLVLERAKQYVDDDNQDWFDGQADMVTMWKGLVEANLLNVKIDDGQSEQFMESGMGSINTGFSSYREINVDNLTALRDALLANG